MSLRRSVWKHALGAIVLCATATGCANLAAADPNALWKIVDIRCVPAEQSQGIPGQCTRVDLKKRYAILKDIFGRSQYLLIPTDRVGGIESPAVIATNAPDYFADAWDERVNSETALKKELRDDQLGLEINSQLRRSQNQLHIHIDCMREDVIDALEPYRRDPLNTWRAITLDSDRYRVMRVTSISGDNDPFRIVSRALTPDQTMAKQTILVTAAGANAHDDGWFIVTSGLDHDDGSGTAEGLQDHACKLAG